MKEIKTMNRPETVAERRKAYFDREFNRRTDETRILIKQKQIEMLKKENEEIRSLIENLK